MRTHDAADGAAVEIRGRVVVQVLEIVECVLDEPRQTSVIGRRSQHQTIALADRFNECHCPQALRR
jgi:hypothetical protein